MLLGNVIGTVVSTRKEEELEGLKLLLVQSVDDSGKNSGSMVVCVDAVGAGVGELVMYAAGSSARQTKLTKDKPVDHVIMAIVDEVTSVNKTLFTKGVGFAKS